MATTTPRIRRAYWNTRPTVRRTLSPCANLSPHPSQVGREVTSLPTHHRSGERLRIAHQFTAGEPPPGRCRNWGEPLRTALMMARVGDGMLQGIALAPTIFVRLVLVHVFPSQWGVAVGCDRGGDGRDRTPAGARLRGLGVFSVPFALPSNAQKHRRSEGKNRST